MGHRHHHLQRLHLHHHATTTSHRSQLRSEPGRRRSAELDETWGSGATGMICKLIQSNKHIPLHPLGGCNKYKKNKVLHCIAKYCMVLHGIAWYCMVLHGIAWYCMILHDITWYGMVLHGIAWFCMVLHGITWYCMVL